MRKLERQELTKLMMTKWLNKKRLIIWNKQNAQKRKRLLLKDFPWQFDFHCFINLFCVKKLIEIPDRSDVFLYYCIISSLFIIGALF